MPSRILKESITTNEQIDMLTPFEETFFYRLIVKTDDYGRYDGRPKILRAALFPLKEISLEEISNALNALQRVGLIRIYVVDGRPYIELTGWERNQSIRAKKSKYPGYDGRCETPEDNEDSAGCEETQLNTVENNCMQMHADDCKCHRNPNPNTNTIKERDIEKESAVPAQTHRKVFIKPSIEDVQAYISGNGYHVNAERWYAFYESKDWMIGKNKMADWKAAVRTWEHSEKARPAPNKFANFEQRDTDYDRLVGMLAGG
jgi:hypothetical protein